MCHVLSMEMVKKLAKYWSILCIVCEDDGCWWEHAVYWGSGLLLVSVKIVVFWGVTSCSLVDGTNVLEQPATSIFRVHRFFCLEVRGSRLHWNVAVSHLWYRREMFFHSDKLASSGQMLAWLTLQPWRWRQYIPLKHHWRCTELHGITFQKIVVLFVVTAVWTSDPPYHYMHIFVCV
jgi:hypothetical protein